MENLTHLVTIVVPVYNAEKFLDACLESIVHQNYQNIEIILINDGSKDNSLTIMKSWKQNDRRIVLLDQDNHGVSYTRNRAICMAKGDFITFIDADDVISPDFIQTLLHSMISTQSDCAVCNIKSFVTGQPILFSDGQNEIHSSEESRNLLFGLFHGFMANKMYKLSIIRSNDIKLNPQIAISEDLLFNFEYMQYANKIVYNYGVKYLYRQHTESAFNRLSNIRWFSVLDTMQILLKKVNDESLAWHSVATNYMMLSYEAKYRLKFCNHVPSEVLSKIYSGILYAENNLNRLNMRDRFKVFIMKTVPSLVMFYRRKRFK